MASLSKKVKTRVARCVEQVMELRQGDLTADEAQQIEQAVDVLRAAAASVDDLFFKAKAARQISERAAYTPPAVASAAPAKAAPVGKPPVYGPTTGVYMAPADGMKGTDAQIIESENDVMHMARRGSPAIEVAEILAGNLGTAYECDAARILSGNPAWEFWTPEERLSAIEDKGRQLEAADDTDYFSDTAAPAAGDAAAV